MLKKLLDRLALLRHFWMAIGLTLVVMLFSPGVYAQFESVPGEFNHLTTGFPLTGMHTEVACETCHIGGIFKGTPINCSGCHTVGKRVVATTTPIKHMITTEECSACHTNTVSFLGGRYHHRDVKPNMCNSCHNGTLGQDRPVKHVLTNAQCDACHRTTSWLPAGFSHLGVIPGSCISCHNGTTAIGRSPSHIVTPEACDTCHLNFRSFQGAGFNHVAAGVKLGECGKCHNGQMSGATIKNASHIPYTGNACDACHVITAGYTTFTGAKMSHAMVTGNLCKTCHMSGTNFSGGMKRKTLNHFSTYAGQTDCVGSGCHSSSKFSSWE